MRESLERGLPELGLDAALIPTLEGLPNWYWNGIR